MSSKYQIIQVDNLSVRKMNLTCGENIVGQIDADNATSGVKVEQAVKINVSTNDEMTIMPCEGISCYIKNYEARRWKQLGANWTVPLRAQDTCLVLPCKIWIKIIPRMDQANEISNPKRKPEKILENEPPDKRSCIELDIVMEAKHVINNNDNNSYSIENVNVQDNKTSKDVNNQDNVENSLLHDSNINKNEKEQESVYGKENNEKFAVKSSKEQESESDCEKKNNKDLNSETEDCVNEDLNNSDSKPVEQNADTSPVNLNTDTDNIDQTTANTQSPPRVKCKYGSQCYRLSAEHKANFSHPGDADYDAPDNRPECPYGLDCYRKNPQHKLDYKHTHSKRKKTRTTARPVPAQDLSDLEDSWEESVDDSDYDPSFIDDDSIEEFESDFDDDDFDDDDDDDDKKD